jgi:hypothetical protein
MRTIELPICEPELAALHMLEPQEFLFFPFCASVLAENPVKVIRGKARNDRFERSLRAWNLGISAEKWN